MNISKISFKSVIRTALLGVAVMFAATATAAVKDCLVVHTTDGEKTYYVLEDIPVVTFVNDNIHIKSASLEEDLKFNTVEQFTFESQEVGAVKNLTDNECRITVRNREVVLEGFKAGTPVAVYSLNGLCVYEGLFNPDGNAVGDLSHLENGVYIVSSVSKSFKIILK